MAEMVFASESFRIMGACFEVYNQMGPGFVEAVYQECMEIELTDRGIPYVPQRQLRLWYKDKELKQVFIPDFFCFDKIVVEIKATSDLNNDFRSKVHNYLRATQQKLGLLVNFGHSPLLQYERIVH